VNEVSNYQTGLRYLSEKRMLEALGVFERAFEANPDSPEIVSYYALLNALERGQVKVSAELARSAIARQSGRPDFYVNLGRIFLKGGMKKEAVETLREGIRAVPDDEELERLLRVLGVRARPFFSSLPRGHVLNKSIGIMAFHLRRFFATI